MTSIISTITLTILFIVLIITSYTDIKYRKIQNKVLLPSLIMVMIISVVGNGLDGFLFSLNGLALGTLCLFFPWLFGQVGAGDAKLMGFVGATLGPFGVFWVFILSTLLAGFFAACQLFFHRDILWEYLRSAYEFIIGFVKTGMLNRGVKGKITRLPGIPGAVAIALGALIYVTADFFGYIFPQLTF